MNALGHETGATDGVGVAQVIGVTPGDGGAGNAGEGGVHAASDPRRGGRPAGY